MAKDVKKTTTIAIGGVAQPGVPDLMLLREATYRFGYIHELQVIQMRIWPSVFLHPAAKVAELRYFHDDRIMELELVSIDKGKLNLTDGALRLDRAVKFLLGVDVRVRVMVQGVDGLLYDGEPRDDTWLFSTSQKESKSSSKSGKRKQAGRRSRRR